MKEVTLSNGVRMPQLGYGVYQVTKDECERCVLDAIGVGYRSIDTAQSYFNEEEMNAVAALDRKQSAFFSHTDPNMVEWFVQMVERRKQNNDCAAEKKNW